jgi:hypothetical protein
MNKVVVRFKDGTVMKGQTSNFFPNKTSFNLQTSDGEHPEIYIENLKAVFFVKDLLGNREHVKRYEDDIAGAGRKIKVRFVDGEEITGYTLGYSPDRLGFLMTPADVTGNNERAFIVASATEKVEFL